MISNSYILSVRRNLTEKSYIEIVGRKDKLVS